MLMPSNNEGFSFGHLLKCLFGLANIMNATVFASDEIYQVAALAINIREWVLLPSGSEENQVLRGRSIPKEYFVIGELGVKAELKVVHVVGNGSIET